MILSFAYLAFSAVLRLLAGRWRNEFAKDVELLVLRHQLVVLGRQQAAPFVPSGRSCVPRGACACGGGGRSRGDVRAVRRSRIVCDRSSCASLVRTHAGDIGA
jgi:hypothetical protein